MRVNACVCVWCMPTWARTCGRVTSACRPPRLLSSREQCRPHRARGPPRLGSPHTGPGHERLRSGTSAPPTRPRASAGTHRPPSQSAQTPREGRGERPGLQRAGLAGCSRIPEMSPDAPSEGLGREEGLSAPGRQSPPTPHPGAGGCTDPQLGGDFVPELPESALEQSPPRPTKVSSCEG